MRAVIIWVAIAASAALSSACKRDEVKPQNASVAVRMTDAPADYQEVNVDVQNVEMRVDGEWFAMDGAVRAGVYNLLDLSGGFDTLLGEMAIPSGNIEEIRLILGTENTVKVNDTLYPLETPSAQQSGLKVKLNRAALSGTLTTVLLDFDAGRSVVAKGNGGYSLKPVIRVVDADRGEIKGRIDVGVEAQVLLYSGIDTVGTTANAEGSFVFKGLAPGTYGLALYPSTASGLPPKVIEGIQLNLDQKLNLGYISW